MEDHSNTSNQKVKYDLSFQLSTDLTNRLSLVEKLRRYVSINESDSQYFLKLNEETLELKDLDTNSVYTFKKLDELIKAIPFLIKTKLKNDFHDIEKGLARVDKIQVKQTTSAEYLSNLSQFLLDTDSLIPFMQKLFRFKSLKSFQTIHLFVHEKGQANSVHYEIERTNSRNYSHSINDFSSLFQSIRKSKNRTYGQSTIKGFDLNILGTFLAHEFPLSNHNIILIISRNDFLPQTQEEVENFSVITKILASFIEIKLQQSLVFNKLISLKSAIKESPFNFYTSSPHLNNISNASMLINTPKQQLASGDFFQISQLEDNILDHGDIFHHERVSLLGELLNTLRHELSNPIFGLQLTTQLLLMEEHNEEQEAFLSEVLASIKRSQNILENFTNIYKDGNSFEQIDIIKLINEVFTLTKSESRHLKKSIQFEKDSLIFNTNPTWFAQIIFNLVINSAQACKDSKGTQFEVIVKQSKKELELHFIDNGPGITPDKSSELFKAFYTTKSKGTGLGLAICKSLTRKLNGDIQYLNNDKGAYFLLKLPYENTSN